MAEWLKAVDLRSNVRCTSWVRFPLLAKPSVAQVGRDEFSAGMNMISRLIVLNTMPSCASVIPLSHIL